MGRHGILGVMGRYSSRVHVHGDFNPAVDMDGAGRTAPCFGLHDIFFSFDIADIEISKAICGTCPNRIGCLQGAKHRREHCGVWGGQLFKDGEIIEKFETRGRKPRPPA